MGILRKDPIIFVIGCTGTGKSDLGVAIAKNYGGEIVSVDSMQLYKGLDIATNKITSEETEGIPHHMMSILQPFSKTRYNVHLFRQQVLEICQQIRERRKIPILVGGTTYYAESILYENNIIETGNVGSSSTSGSDSEPEKDQEFEADSRISNEDLWSELNRVDPETASLLHKNNRHRVWRAIQIYKQTGKKRSEIILQQKSNKNDVELGGKLRFEDSLVIYLDAKKEVLEERLDSRVEKMIGMGLKKELVEFYELHKNHLDENSFGVMQCIGWKEFVPWLKLEEKREENMKLFEEGCEKMKTRTKQYAKHQRLWYFSRLLKRANGERKMASTKMLDTSEKSRIISDGLKIVDEWMLGNDLHEDVNMSNEQNIGEHLHRFIECEICEMRVQGSVNWKLHLAGKTHKHHLKMRKKLAENVENQ